MAKEATIRFLEVAWSDSGTDGRILMPSAAPLPPATTAQAKEWQAAGVRVETVPVTELGNGKFHHANIKIASMEQQTSVAGAFHVGRICSWFTLGRCHDTECKNWHLVVSKFGVHGSGPGGAAP